MSDFNLSSIDLSEFNPRSLTELNLESQQQIQNDVYLAKKNKEAVDNLLEMVDFKTSQIESLSKELDLIKNKLVTANRAMTKMKEGGVGLSSSVNCDNSQLEDPAYRLGTNVSRLRASWRV